MPERRFSVSALLRSRPLATLAIGLAAFAVVTCARELGWLVSWELGAYDNYLRALPPRTEQAPVTLVWIREAEISEYGHPLPDHVMVSALERLLEHRPRAVGIDVYRDRPTGEGWEELRELFRAHPELVIVEKLADAQHPAVPPPPFLNDRRQVGFADIAPDPDGVTRRGLLMLWDEQGQVYLSLSLQLALLYLHGDGISMTADPETPEYVRIGPTTLPPFRPDLGGYQAADAGGYQYLLDYRRANGSFPSLNLSQVLAGDFDPALVQGRILLLGTKSPSVKDYFQTPTGFASDETALVYGAEHHAHAIDQLTRYGFGIDAPIAAPGEWQETFWVLLWCLAGAGIATRVRSPLSLVVTVLLGLAVLLGGGYWAFAKGWWIPVVPAAAGGLGSVALVVAYVTQQERADKAKAMNLFGRYVSRRLVDRIWEQRDLFMEGDRPRPQRITVTVMLSDLIGYTSRSEKSEPSEVMEWLGTYMDRMAQLIEMHGGMVNDFLGDGIMASFGVPVPSSTEEEIDRDARNAVECALAMGDALRTLNQGWRERGLPTARMRIGILTGPAVVGDIGSQDRMKYATVGNTVNTASRLEGFDKMGFELEPEQSTLRILVGQSTLDRLGGEFATKCLGAHVLKGKGEPLTIHRVLGPSRDPRPRPEPETR